MFTTAKCWNARFAPAPSTLIAALLLTGCAASMQPSPEPMRPLLLAVCPPLQPLADDTFGAVMLKLEEVATTYRKCRAAAIGEP